MICEWKKHRSHAADPFATESRVWHKTLYRHTTNQECTHCMYIYRRHSAKLAVVPQWRLWRVQTEYDIRDTQAFLLLWGNRKRVWGRGWALLRIRKPLIETPKYQMPNPAKLWLARSRLVNSFAQQDSQRFLRLVCINFCYRSATMKGMRSIFDR